MQLQVAELIVGFKDHDGRVSNEVGDLYWGLEDGVDDWDFVTLEVWFEVVHLNVKFSQICIVV